MKLIACLWLIPAFLSGAAFGVLAMMSEANNLYATHKRLMDSAQGAIDAARASARECLGGAP